MYLARSRTGMITRNSSQVTYYVDSVNGSDANDGTSAAQAFQTFAALPTINEGESVGLARGSTWLETLALPANNIRIVAVGTGDDPLIDCTDALTSGGWTDSTGRADANTNVYSRTVTLGSATPQQFVNVYEDGINLVLVANVATCQSTPGSYYITSHTITNPTLYIHPTGSGNPASNGKTYRHSARQYAISAGARSNITLRSIHTRGNLGNNGSIYLGRYGLIDACVVEDGGAHNLLLADGGVLKNSNIRNAYCNASANIVVFYDVNPVSAGITISNCQFSNRAWDTNINGPFCHSDGTGNLGTFTIEDCAFTNINVCISHDDIAAITIRRNTATNCKKFFRAGQAITCTLNNNTVSGAVSGQTINAVETGVAGAIINLTDEVYDIDSPANAAVFVQHSNTVLTMNNVHIEQVNASVASGCVMTNSSLSGIALTIYDSELISNSGQNIRGLSAPASYEGDRNCFDLAGGINIRWGGSTYTSLATWQAASTQDANSSVGCS